MCARSLRILERESGPDHPDVANVLNTYGDIHLDLSRYTEAESFFRRSVRITADLSGDPDLERLRLQSLTGLAGCLRMHGRYRDAEPLFERALALAEAAFGPEDLEVSTILNNWAIVYKYSARFDRAESL